MARLSVENGHQKTYEIGQSAQNKNENKVGSKFTHTIIALTYSTLECCAPSVMNLH